MPVETKTKTRGLRQCAGDRGTETAKTRAPSTPPGRTRAATALTPARAAEAEGARASERARAGGAELARGRSRNVRGVTSTDDRRDASRRGRHGAFRGTGRSWSADTRGTRVPGQSASVSGSRRSSRRVAHPIAPGSACHRHGLGPRESLRRPVRLAQRLRAPLYGLRRPAAAPVVGLVTRVLRVDVKGLARGRRHVGPRPTPGVPTSTPRHFIAAPTGAKTESD